MVELFLDRLQPGRSELEFDEELVRAEELIHGHRVPALRARVSGVLNVDAMDHKVLVHGEFTARREMLCDRSGEAFEMSYPAALEILILRSSGRDRHGAGEEDAWVIEQSGGVVNLDAALLEAVVLDEPQRVVSPQHEQDEVVGDDAEPTEIDPRWEALRQLRGTRGEGDDPKSGD